MAYTAINDPEAYFQAVLWSGNDASPRTITLGGDTDLQPDIVWLKKRDGADHSQLYDSARTFAASKDLVPSETFSEGNASNLSVGLGYVSAVTSDGFTLTEGNHATSSIRSLLTNKDGNIYVGWCWKESATAGLDIVTFTGDGSARTISHNLSAVPHCMIVRTRNPTSDCNYSIYHHKNTAAPETDHIFWDSTQATEDDATIWNDTAPTSSVFSLSTNVGVNEDTKNCFAYLWSEKQGFSKFGGYEGNGNADGTFVYTGFRPAFIMVHSIDSTDSWHTFDNKREGYNVDNDALFAEATAVEGTSDQIDMLSNGFKCRIATDPNVAETYIYMAFAEAPFVNSEGVPNNAR